MFPLIYINTQIELGGKDTHWFNVLSISWVHHKFPYTFPYLKILHPSLKYIQIFKDIFFFEFCFICYCIVEYDNFQYTKKRKKNEKEERFEVLFTIFLKGTFTLKNIFEKK